MKSEAMWKHQLDAVSYMRTAFKQHGGGLLAMEMGTGKTRVALRVWESLVAAVERRASGVSMPMLAVCPKSVTSAWKSEVAKVFGSDVDVWVSTNIKGSTSEKAEHLKEWLAERSYQRAIVVAHYDMLKNEALMETLLSQRWLLGVVDESHQIRNANTVRSSAVGALRSSCRYKLCMTGTPCPNDVMDYWAQLRFCAPHMFETSGAMKDVIEAKQQREAHKLLMPIGSWHRFADGSWGVSIYMPAQTDRSIGKLATHNVVDVLVKRKHGSSSVKRVQLTQGFELGSNKAVGEVVAKATPLRSFISEQTSAKAEADFYDL